MTLEIKNGILFKNDIVVGDGDILISPNGFRETITWSGLTQVTTNMRRLTYDVLIDSGYDVENIFDEGHMNDITKFLMGLGINKEDEFVFSRKGNGNALIITFRYPNQENNIRGRSVGFYVGTDDNKKAKMRKDFSYAILKDNKLVFYYNHYINVKKGLELINEGGKMKINSNF